MDNKIGAYFTYWASEYNAPYDDCLRRAAAIGFDSVGVRGTGVVRFTDEQKQATKDLADSLGLSLNYGMMCSNDIASESEETRNAAVQEGFDIIDAIAFMKGEMMSGPFFAPWKSTLPAGVTDKRPHMRRSAEGMKRICDYAKEKGVKVNIELTNRYENYMINTVEEGLEYLDMVGSDNLGLHLDTFHMGLEEPSLIGAIKKAGDRLGHFHIAEANRDVPGPNGRIHWGDIFDALGMIGYKHIIEFEPFVVTGTEIGANINLWRDLTRGQDLDEKMQASFDYIKELVRKA